MERVAEHNEHRLIDLILSLRLIVARAGEKDGLGWWESDALSSAGTYVLQRIFPRSASWAGIQLAIEAATIRHKGILGNQPALSLFMLGDEVDHSVMEHMDRLRRGGNVLPIPGPIQSSSELAAVLQEQGGVSHDDYPPPEAPQLFDSQVLEIGQCRGQETWSSEQLTRLAKSLAGSYTRGDKGRLIVPYVRVIAR